jgi:ABC-type Fe3+ transport system permease subunit
MLTLALLAFLGIRKYVSLRQYAMLSKGGRWSPRVSKPRLWQALAIYLILLPLLLFTITPQAGVVKLAFTQEHRVVTNVTGIQGEIIGTAFMVPPNKVFLKGELNGYNDQIRTVNGSVNGILEVKVNKLEGGKVLLTGQLKNARFQGTIGTQNGTVATDITGDIRAIGVPTQIGALKGYNITNANITFTMYNIPAGKETKLTLKYIKQMLLTPDVRRYIINSLLYASAAVVLIILLSITSSYATSRFKGSLTPVLESTVILPMAVPGIVVAMGYFYFFHLVFPGTPIDPINPRGFNPAYVLILAYSVRRLPFAARSVYAGLQQVHVSLDEASMNLGASRWKTLTSIILPLISLNVFGGAMLSFVYAMSETSVGITLGSLNMAKAPITAFMKEIMLSAVGSVNIAAALGVLLITVQILSILLVNIITKQRYSFIGLS